MIFDFPNERIHNISEFINTIESIKFYKIVIWFLLIMLGIFITISVIVISILLPIRLLW